jgi:hypothetical protein
LPFDGPTPVDIWQAHVEQAPRAPIDLAPGAISPALNAIILRLLAKKAEHRIQTAADFCTALESIGDDGQSKVIPGRLPSADLARHRTSLPAAIHVSHKPANYDELATTTEDLPAVQLPQVAFSEEDRRQEIEDLRASLGLHIEEPASDSQETEQLSALVIDLGTSHTPPVDCKIPPRTHAHSLPLLGNGTTVRRSARPVEERKYVPRLAAPSLRASGPARTTTEVAMRTPSQVWKIVRGVMVVALLVAATVLAVKFIR